MSERLPDSHPANRRPVETISRPGGPSWELDANAAALLSRPSTAKGRLQRAALCVLLEHEANDALPTSTRFVFYELEQCGVLTKERPPLRPGAKGQRRPDQPLAEAIKHLRDVGVVPWGWITDQTRHVFAYRYAATVADYLRDRLPEARINPWGDEPPPLILCEARTMVGALEGIARAHVCPITATNGQVGGFLHTEVAPIIPGRVVLYLGDLDLRGDLIERNTRRVLEHKTGHAIDWQRLAITAAQVAERELEPIVKTDAVLRRTHEAFECEALGQRVVMDLVAEALAARLPEPLDRVLEREEDQRAAERDRLQ